MRRRTGKLLYESDNTFVAQEGDLICLEQFGPWTSQLTRLANEHKVNALFISETYQKEWPSLKFLFDLPPLHRLHVVLSRPADLTPITQLPSLEFLGLMGDIAREDVDT